MGSINSYEYNEHGDRIAMIEAVGTGVERRTEFTYTAEGNLRTKTIKGKTTTEDSTVNHSYDPSGHLTMITDPEGRQTRFLDYNPVGNPQIIEDGRGYRKHFEYDAAGNLRFVRDHNNKLLAEYRYDAAGNRSAILDGYLKEYSYAYDSRKNLTAVIDPLGNIKSRDYNLAGKPIKITDQENHPVYYEYDLNERLTKTIDGEGNTTSYQYIAADDCSSCYGGSELISTIIYPTFTREFTYDNRGRVSMQKDILENEERTTSYTYDSRGNRNTLTDPESKITTYNYDKLGRLTSERDAAGNTTSYRYDTRGNLVQLTDANSGITLFTYDRSDRQLSEVKPLLQSMTYSYDAAGNLAEQIDGNGRKTVHTYDTNNRLVQSAIFSTSSATTPAKTITYSYNDAGSLTGYNDGTTSATYTYDDLQRRIGETVNYGTFSLAQAYGYYKNGLKHTYTDPAGRIRTWTYDQANRPLGLDPGNGSQVSIGSYEWNRPGTITLPGGATLNYVYNKIQQVTSITPRDPGGNPVLDYDYTYSASGNVAAKSTEHGSYSYNYDQLYRLITASKPASEENFTYDPVANRTSSQDVDTWTYNANNQLTGYGSTTFAYDNQGNMTTKTVDGTTSNFDYTVDNRLQQVKAQNGTVIASYYYDPYGRRLWKEVAGVRTYFAYNDEGLAGEYSANGNEQRTYGFRPGSTWTTSPLFVQENGVYYWYLNDHLGTPQKMISSNGTTVWSARYDSFGKAFVEVETVKNNLRFPGQYFDYETGLHYNWHRFYDPETGRYISADPIGLAGGMNLYAYANQNPVNAVDPWGLLCKIVQGDKYAGGNPIDEWEETKKIGYWKALIDYLFWLEFLRSIPLPIPDPGVKFGYIERHSIWQLFDEYIDYWEVCYDECGNETSRDFVGKGKTGKTKKLLLDQWDVQKYIGGL